MQQDKPTIEAIKAAYANVMTANVELTLCEDWSSPVVLELRTALLETARRFRDIMA